MSLAAKDRRVRGLVGESPPSHRRLPPFPSRVREYRRKSDARPSLSVRLRASWTEISVGSRLQAWFLAGREMTILELQVWRVDRLTSFRLATLSSQPGAWLSLPVHNSICLSSNGGW
jgi:hypothetical protein